MCVFVCVYVRASTGVLYLCVVVLIRVDCRIFVRSQLSLVMMEEKVPKSSRRRWLVK